MSLEEVAVSQPELFEKLIIGSRAKLQAQRTNIRLAADWPKALAPGPNCGAIATEAIRHALLLADSLEYRTIAFSRNAAPQSVHKNLAREAERMVGHLRTLSKRRERTPELAAKIAHNLISNIATKQSNTEIENNTITAQEAGIRATRSIPKCVAFLSEAFLSSHAFSLVNLIESPQPDDGALQAMYQAPRFVSKHDNIRFDTMEELQKHSAQHSVTKQSRVWAPTQRQWCTERLLDVQREIDAALPSVFGSINAQNNSAHFENQEDEAFQPVPAPPDGATTHCPVCGDAFDLEYRNDHFILQHAVIVPVADSNYPVAVHIRCRDATCGRNGTLQSENLLKDIQEEQHIKLALQTETQMQIDTIDTITDNTKTAQETHQENDMCLDNNEDDDPSKNTAVRPKTQEGVGGQDGELDQLL